MRGMEGGVVLCQGVNENSRIQSQSYNKKQELPLHHITMNMGFFQWFNEFINGISGWMGDELGTNQPLMILGWGAQAKLQNKKITVYSAGKKKNSHSIEKKIFNSHFCGKKWRATPLGRNTCGPGKKKFELCIDKKKKKLKPNSLPEPRLQIDHLWPVPYNETHYYGFTKRL